MNDIDHGKQSPKDVIDELRDTNERLRSSVDDKDRTIHMLRQVIIDIAKGKVSV